MNDITTTAAFRELVAQRYPRLNDNPAYWRMMRHLLFPGRRDPVMRRQRVYHQPFPALYDGIPIPQEILARIEGREHELRARHYRGRDFIERFKRDILPEIVVQDYAIRRECRMVLLTGIAQDIVEACERDLSDRAGQPLVYFVTGRAVTADARQGLREAILARSWPNIGEAGGDDDDDDDVGADCHGQASRPKCREAAHILTYLHDLRPNRFQSLIGAHIEAARQLALTLPDARRELALMQLAYFEGQPQPFYKPTRKSVRLSPSTRGLLRMPSEIRRCLTQDWVELDLKAAQVSIAARFWDIPELATFLEGDRDIWRYLAAGCGVALEDGAPLDAGIKAALKKGTYALCFGIGREAFLDPHGEIEPDFSAQNLDPKRFRRIDLIQALLQRRNRQFQRITHDGGARDCFGNWIAVDGDIDPPSVLAQIMQAWEMALIYPIYERAQTTQEFTVMLHQHDGVTIHFRQQQRRGRWIREIQEAVQTKARELTIPTYLEVKT